MYNFTLYKKVKLGQKKNFWYWDYYALIDKDMTKNFLNIRPVHYFNEIPYTPWPFSISFSLFFVVFGVLLSFKQFEYAYYILYSGLGLTVYFMFGWFNDLSIESIVFGKYNRKVRQSLTYAFILFLCSEIALFGCFFWAYFDRLFDPISVTGGIGLPYGVEPLFKNVKPVFATFLLITSGFFANLSFLSIKYSYFRALNASTASIVLGSLFLYIQYLEYTTLLFTIADSVYCSAFYLLTGFHGAHVIVGLVFLLVQQDRLYKCQFNRERHQGYMFAVFYWHFVDYIWIFLFFSVYVANWSLSYYYLW